MGLGCYESKLNFKDTLGIDNPTVNNPIANTTPSIFSDYIEGTLSATSLDYPGYKGTIEGHQLSFPHGNITVDDTTLNGCFYERVNGIPQNWAIIRMGDKYSVKYRNDVSANVNTYELERIK